MGYYKIFENKRIFKIELKIKKEKKNTRVMRLIKSLGVKQQRVLLLKFKSNNFSLRRQLNVIV